MVNGMDRFCSAHVVLWTQQINTEVLEFSKMDTGTWHIRTIGTNQLFLRMDYLLLHCIYLPG